MPITYRPLTPTDRPTLAAASGDWILAMSEDWARAQGHRRIRAWSTVDKTQAIPMWHALGFRLRPVYSGRPRRKSPNGYYVAKPL